MYRKILTPPILIVSFVSFLTDISSEMLYPVMPIYLKSIGFSVMLIGILEGLAEATAGLSKGYFGKMSDLSGKRGSFVRAEYMLSAISKPMMGLFIYPVWIFLQELSTDLEKVSELPRGMRYYLKKQLLKTKVRYSDFTGQWIHLEPYWVRFLL